MPFSYGCGSIAGILEGIRNGELLGADDHTGITTGNIGVRMTESIFTRQQSIARRGTGGCNSMDIGEADAALGQGIHIRCLHTGSAETLQIAIAKVIGKDDNHIGERSLTPDPSPRRGENIES